MYNPAMQPILNIHLLGGFLVEYKGKPITAFSADRLQSLLAYLLLNRTAPQPRHHLAFQLWPDSSESQARTNLRNLLHNLRANLPESEIFLDITNLTLQWRPDAPFQLDVERFQQLRAEAAIAESRHAWGDARRLLEEAIILYRGDLLPGNYDDWISGRREDLRHTFTEALTRLIDILERMGDLSAALQHAQRLLRDDPLNETTYVILMRLYAQSGDRSSIRRIYDQCAATLQRELSVEPSATTQSAYQQFLRMDALLPTVAVPPPAAIAPARRRLTPPKSSTGFIGREAELAQLAQLIADPHVRLLTITGPGGIGKTQLAMQMASGHTSIFADGAAFIGLASIVSADVLAQSIAAGIEVRLSGGADPEEQLLNALRDRELLLVLDNFEHLLDGAETLSEILLQAPAVKIVVTSRERLNLHEEWVYNLHGLPIPDGDEEDWEENSAVQLFLQSARRANAGFILTPADRPAITHICRLLEGMPLGIQLAAAWARLLAPAEIAQEIERSLAFLESSYRDVPERHRSLQAVFEHSWRLLSAQEQVALRQLSLFRGGFDRHAAEEIAGATLPLLSALVDKSLVRRADTSRYSLHEVVRQYADSVLRAAGDFEEARLRHLQHYLALANDLQKKLYGPLQPELLEQLEIEHDNLRAALDWAFSSGSAIAQLAAIRLTTILARFWYLRGHLHEGRNWMERALAALEGDPVPEASPNELRWLRARLLFGVGEVVAASDDTRAAVPLLEESLAIFRQLQSGRDVIMLLHRLSETVSELGDYARAEQLLEESLPLARAQNETWLVGRSLSILASMSIDQGNPARAEAMATEALTLLRGEDDSGAVVYLLNVLGQLAAQQGDLARAEAMLEEALTINRTVTRLRMGAAWTLRNLGMVAQLQGDLARATAYFQESLVLRHELRQLSGAAWALEGLAEIAALAGDPQRAVRLWAVAAAQRAIAGSEMGEADRMRTESLLAELRLSLGEAHFNALWTEGSALPFEDAIAYALMNGDW
ncbi:MAG: tetratricopeptide repeat protein [Caldilineaceae bacterium]|nr:tetratricopeptide repeat protein [Caldilineaceae bacterium]